MFGRIFSIQIFFINCTFNTLCGCFLRVLWEYQLVSSVLNSDTEGVLVKHYIEVLNVLA